MAWHEILKYSPKNYKNRIYTVDEWTSRCEVGKYFNGKQFTIEEYLRVEQQHINVILSIMKAVQSKFVVIRYLEADKADIIESIQDSKFHDIDSPLLQSIPLLEVKKRIHPNEIPDIVRMALREYIYVELGDKEHKFKIQFGYDYYLYVACTLPKEELQNIVAKEGLFLDPR